MGPLVGVSFISAVRTYAEVSGLNGTSAGVGEALSPLIGVWAPTFSACELAAVFLLPFVAIRLVAGDRQSGALKLELQQGMSPFARITAKALVLLAGWLVAMLPPLSAILLWKSYGGTVYAPELVTLAFGHLLNAGLTIGLAAAMSSVTEHPSTAAILTLSVTVGTWIVSFFGAVQGGWWERAAGYTPAAIVAEFQHGLLRLDTVLIALVRDAGGLASPAAIWMRLGTDVSRRANRPVSACSRRLHLRMHFLHASWDTSEARGNSFSEGDERAIRQIHAPLRIEAHLAPEDPRRIDLEHHALSKLRRIMPASGAVCVGLVDRAFRTDHRRVRRDLVRPGRPPNDEPHDDGGRCARSDLTRWPASRRLPKRRDDLSRASAGRPANGAGIVFYAVWPALFLVSGFIVRRRFQ